MWKPFYVIHSYVYRKRPNQQNQPKPTQPKWTQPIQTKPGETKTNQIRNWRFLVVFHRWLYPKSLLQCVAKSVTQGCPMRIIDIQPFCKGQLNLLSTNSGWCWEVQLCWVHGIFSNEQHSTFWWKGLPSFNVRTHSRDKKQAVQHCIGIQAKQVAHESLQTERSTKTSGCSINPAGCSALLTICHLD